MWLIFALSASLFAALVAIFAKLGLKNIDSILATTIRSVIMAIFLVIVSLLFRTFQGFSFNSLSSRSWIFIILAGISGALSWLFYFAALKFGIASHVVAIERMSLIFVIFLAAIFLGEALNWKSVLGGVLMVIGIILIVLK